MSVAPAGSAAGVPGPGDAVADFTAVSTGGDVRLAALRGNPVVLYFYPKNDTPGCTAQAADFRDRHAGFRAAGATVLGVSRDGLASHQRFKAKLDVPFELISDPDEQLCRAFGVIKPKTLYGRTVRGIERSTFVIDGSGRIAGAWRAVSVPGHVDEVLSLVQSLPP